jgi:hypothetical protein
MTTRYPVWGCALAAAALWAAQACAGAEPRGLAPAARQAGATPSLQRACVLADRRCSRCHPIERVLVAHVSEPAEWSDYVHRMRLTPGSGISAREEPIILRCLLEHSFGPQARR